MISSNSVIIARIAIELVRPILALPDCISSSKEQCPSANLNASNADKLAIYGANSMTNFPDLLILAQSLPGLRSSVPHTQYGRISFLSGPAFRTISSDGKLTLASDAGTADGLVLNATSVASAGASKSLVVLASSTITLDGELTDTEVQAAINSVPSGGTVSIRLSATARVHLVGSPALNGRTVSWDIAPQVVFTGSGTLPGPTSPSLFAPDHRLVSVQRVKGSATAPTTEPEPVAIFDKQSGAVSGLNSTVAVTGTKRGGGDGTALSALSVEAFDAYGWPNRGSGGNPFIEGARINAFCAPGLQLCSTYGVVAGAGAGSSTTSHRFAIGAEMTVFNNNADAPPTTQFSPTTSMMSSFHATNDGTKKIDAFYLTNPYIAGSGHAPARAGVLIASGSVSDVAFASQASSLRGLDLSMGSFSEAAIALPNGAAIKARDAAGRGWISMLYTDGADAVTLGNGARTVVLNGGVFAAAGALFRGAVSAPKLVATSKFVAPFGAPASAAAPCEQGQIQIDATYIYTCVATNSWRRAPNGASW